MGPYQTTMIDSERFSKCEVCLEYLPIEYYFTTGDTLFCRECGTEYSLHSIEPLKLSRIQTGYSDSFIREMTFDE